MVGQSEALAYSRPTPVDTLGRVRTLYGTVYCLHVPVEKTGRKYCAEIPLMTTNQHAVWSVSYIDEVSYISYTSVCEAM